MQLKAMLSVLLLLGIAIIVAGCAGTQSPATPAPTQNPVSTVAATATTTGSSLVPSPTDTMVASRLVTVNVEKDYLGNVIFTFQGGSGLIHVNSLSVTLNRADGVVKTASLGTHVDDAVTLEGTKDTDRVMVYASMDDGKTYKIVDALSAYRTRM
jgi:hypothetical protein